MESVAEEDPPYLLPYKMGIQFPYEMGFRRSIYNEVMGYGNSSLVVIGFQWFPKSFYKYVVFAKTKKGFCYVRMFERW